MPCFARPLLAMSSTVKAMGKEESKSDSSPILYPGVTVLFNVPDSAFFLRAPMHVSRS